MPRKVTPTYILLNQITLAASSANILLSNIPQAYSDLVIAIDSNAPDNSYAVNALRFNNDSGNNYSFVGMGGNGTTVVSGTNASLSYASVGQSYGIGPSSGARFSSIVNIFDYSSIDKHKTMLSRNNVTINGVEAQAVRWASTSAITSISVITTSGAGYGVGTTISIYGIVA